MSAVEYGLQDRRVARAAGALARANASPLDGFVHLRVRRKHPLFRAGQPARCVYLVHAGVFKRTVLDAHGRERVTGFALKGDLLGIEALRADCYASDAVALDVGDVIELPRYAVIDPANRLLPLLAAAMAAASERDWTWMLALHTLDAEQRVARFLLDHAERLTGMGFSPSRIVLRMTRADIGSFLDIASESVARSMTRLDNAGLIRVSCRDIELLDRVALARLLEPADDEPTRRARGTLALH